MVYGSHNSLTTIIDIYISYYIATCTSPMSPLFHLFVLFCRSLMKSSFVSQGSQLFPAVNPSAKCCCAHETSFSFAHLWSPAAVV
jgi:hypothetical protein